MRHILPGSVASMGDDRPQLRPVIAHTRQVWSPHLGDRMLNRCSPCTNFSSSRAGATSAARRRRVEGSLGPPSTCLGVCHAHIRSLAAEDPDVG